MKKLKIRYFNLDEEADADILELLEDISYKYLSQYPSQKLFCDVWRLDSNTIITRLLFSTEELLKEFKAQFGSPVFIREVFNENIGYCSEYCIRTYSENRRALSFFNSFGVRYSIQNDSNNGEVTLSISPYIQISSEYEQGLIRNDLKRIAELGWVRSSNNDTSVFLKLRRE